MRFRLALIITVPLAGCISINNDRPTFSDPEVAMVMRVANLSEAREGELAREKAADPAVRDFGAAMVTEHSAANSKAESELANALWGVYQMIGKLSPRVYVLAPS